MARYKVFQTERGLRRRPHNDLTSNEMPRYRVSLTERVYIDWVVEVDAWTEAAAEEIAQQEYYNIGSPKDSHHHEAFIDWSKTVKIPQRSKED